MIMFLFQQCVEASPCFENVTCENREGGFFCPQCPEGLKGVAIHGVGLEAAKNTRQVECVLHV